MNTPATPYPPHPISLAFPPIPPDECEDSIQSVRENGLIEDIVLLEGQVLDGRHRQDWCFVAGVEPRYREFGSRPSDGTSPTTFAWTVNTHRRHLPSPSVRAAIAAELQKHWLAEGGPNGESKSKVEATTTAAAAVGVSVSYVQKAADVQEQNPEDFDKLKTGQATLADVAPAAQKKKRQSKKAAAEALTRANPLADKVRADVANAAKEEHGEEFANAITGNRVLTTLDELNEWSELDPKVQKKLVPLLTEGTALKYSRKVLDKEFDGHDRLSVLVLRAKANAGKPLKVTVDGYEITVKPAKVEPPPPGE